MTFKSAKISMQQMTQSVEKLEQLAVTQDQVRTTRSLKVLITTGDIGRDFTFFEQMNLEGGGRRSSKGPSVPVSRRSSAARGYSANQKRNSSRALSSNRSNSIESTPAQV